MVPRDAVKLLGEPPEILYKYRSARGPARLHLERLIVHREAYFASMQEFNDPFEGGFELTFRDISDAELDRFLAEAVYQPLGVSLEEQSLTTEPDASQSRDNAAKLSSERVESFTGDLGVFSMSEDRSHILLWSHYADAHRGVCLGFRTDVEESVFSALQVLYSEKYPRLLGADLVKGADREHRRKKILGPALLTKATQWEYEAEWRALQMETGVFEYPSECLAEVIFGCEISDTDRAEITHWIDSLSRRPHLFQARREENSYSLAIEPIP